MSEPEKQPDPPSKKSMSEFDYFTDDVPMIGVGRGEQSKTALLKRKRRLLLHAVLTGFVCILLGSLVWGEQEIIAYHFRPQQVAVDLGRVDEQAPGVNFPHDTLVRLSGVTEARAAQVKWIRGLDWRANYRYFHLLGSPVFIEIPSDGSQGKIDAFETVELEGRLIDLSKTNEYNRLLDFLEDKLRMSRPEHPYMLQVGVKPDGGTRAIILLLVVMLIPALNITLWVRAWRRLQKRRI